MNNTEITKKEYRELMDALCERLGYAPIAVSRITLEPGRAVVTGALLRNGVPFVIEENFAMFEEEIQIT